MMNSTPPNDTGISDDELALQLYDVVMRDIEPDLLSYNLPKLSEFYKDESPEEHAKRMDRYRSAYSQFETAWGEFMSKVQTHVAVGQKQALASKEAAAAQAEEADLNQAADAIDSF